MLHGAADLVLLVMLSWILQIEEKSHWVWGVIAGLLIGISSAIPFWLPVVGYLVVVGIITLFQKRIWQVPLWILLVSTFIGTIVVYSLEIVYLWIIGVPIDLLQALNTILLPSLVLNMVIVYPVYGIIGEIIKLVSPNEADV